MNKQEGAFSMDEQEMWEMLDLLGGRITESSTRTLVASLGNRTEDQIVAFHTALIHVLGRLDTPTHRDQLVSDAGDPSSAPPLAMSEDVFLLARCAVVAAGRKRYNEILERPEELAGTWDLAEANRLLEAAPAAFEAVAGVPWALDDDEILGGPHEQQRPADAMRWLDFPTGWDGVDDRRGHVSYWLDVAAQKLQADPEARAWFESLGVQEVCLFPLYTSEGAQPLKLRMGKKRVTAEFTRTAADLFRPELTPQENAEAEVSELFQLTRQAVAARKSRKR